MMEDTRSAAERLALCLVSLFEQACDSARSCEEVAALKGDQVSASAFGSVTREIERALACARRIHNGLAQDSTLTPSHRRTVGESGE
jgi:hypothetical protein